MLPENITLAKYRRIKKPAKKIVYLFSLVSKQERFQENEDALVGVLDMINGLEYHFKKIKRHEKSAYRRVLELESLHKNKELCLSDLSPTNHHLASHEAVAYINRVGQLAYLFKSDWFTKVVPKGIVASTALNILALQPLRNKFTAHRQIDKPWKDDCSSLGLHQHGLNHGLAYPIGTPEEVRIEYQFPTKQREKLLDDYKIPAISGVEYFGDNNNIVIFRPTENHSAITSEVIHLIERFFEIECAL